MANAIARLLVSCASTVSAVSQLRLPHTGSASVYVADFLTEFWDDELPGIRDMGLAMDHIYGSPICAGTPEFIPRAEDAPPGFCRYTNGMPDTEVMWNHQRHAYFDEFNLERIMIAKWLASPLSQCEESWMDCKEKADIVVVPSWPLHTMARWGYDWALLIDVAMLNESLTMDWEPWHATARRYWEAVRQRFFDPDRGYTPMLVIHLSFVPDNAAVLAMLHTLAEQPTPFVERVVIPSLESNFKLSDQSAMIDWSSDSPGPTFITLPYPTSILLPGDFLKDDGPFVASKPRDVRVSLMVTAKPNQTVIREDMINVLKWAIGNRTSGFAQLAVERQGSTTELEGVLDETIVALYCSNPSLQNANCSLAEQDMWTVTANSDFCMEPAGDTLTRSHLYIAVLSGCIPVIVDGGHLAYSANEATAWAWRRGATRWPALPGGTDIEGMLDYTDFAVVFKAEDIHSGAVDMVKELAEMPTNDPERFQSLRRNLKRVAPLMRYAEADCSALLWDQTQPWCRDAFTVFQQMMVDRVK